MTTTDKAGGTTVNLLSDTELELVRVFDAPRRLVWQAFTSPEHIQQWMLGPEGWTMPVCEMDLRPGGAWHYVWRRGNDTEMEMHGEYLEIQPVERLVQTERWGGDWAETVNTLLLDEHDGRTTMRHQMRFPTCEARDRAMQTGMNDGADRSYDLLAELLRTMS